MSSIPLCILSTSVCLRFCSSPRTHPFVINFNYILRTRTVNSTSVHLFSVSCQNLFAIVFINQQISAYLFFLVLIKTNFVSKFVESVNFFLKAENKMFVDFCEKIPNGQIKVFQIYVFTIFLFFNIICVVTGLVELLALFFIRKAETTKGVLIFLHALSEPLCYLRVHFSFKQILGIFKLSQSKFVETKLVFWSVLVQFFAWSSFPMKILKFPSNKTGSAGNALKLLSG